MAKCFMCKREVIFAKNVAGNTTTYEFVNGYEIGYQENPEFDENQNPVHQMIPTKRQVYQPHHAVCPAVDRKRKKPVAGPILR